MNHRLRHSQSIQKFVPKALAQVSVRHQAGNVDQLDGDEPHPVLASSATLLNPQILAGAGDAHIRDAMVGVDRGKGIVGYIHLYQGRSLEKGGFARIRLSSQPDREHIRSEFPLSERCS